MNEMEINLKNIEMLACDFDSNSISYESLLLISHIYIISEEIRSSKIFYEKFRYSYVSLYDYKNNILNEIKSKLETNSNSVEEEIDINEYNEFISRSRNSLEYLESIKENNGNEKFKASYNNIIKSILNTLDSSDSVLCYSLFKKYNF